MYHTQNKSTDAIRQLGVVTGVYNPQDSDWQIAGSQKRFIPGQNILFKQNQKVPKVDYLT